MRPLRQAAVEYRHPRQDTREVRRHRRSVNDIASWLRGLVMKPSTLPQHEAPTSASIVFQPSGEPLPQRKPATTVPEMLQLGEFDHLPPTERIHPHGNRQESPIAARFVSTYGRLLEPRTAVLFDLANYLNYKSPHGGMVTLPELAENFSFEQVGAAASNVLHNYNLEISSLGAPTRTILKFTELTAICAQHDIPPFNQPKKPTT